MNNIIFSEIEKIFNLKENIIKDDNTYIYYKTSLENKNKIEDSDYFDCPDDGEIIESEDEEIIESEDEEIIENEDEEIIENKESNNLTDEEIRFKINNNLKKYTIFNLEEKQKKKKNYKGYSFHEKLLIYTYYKLNLNLEQMDKLKIILKYFNKNLQTNNEPFKKLLNLNCNVYHYCNNCSILFKCSKRKKKLNCTICSADLNKNFFYYNSIIKYISEILINEKNFQDLNYFNKPDLITGDYKDFNDGFVFKFIKKNFEKTNSLSLYFTLNTDGLNLLKNKKNSLYPWFLSINNCPPSMRRKKEYNYLFCLYNKKKKIQVPYDEILYLFVEELNQLKNGIKIGNVLVQ
jgi:hypothetical protein